MQQFSGSAKKVQSKSENDGQKTDPSQLKFLFFNNGLSFHNKTHRETWETVRSYVTYLNSGVILL